MKSKNTFTKSRNTLIFQTNYHTSRLILLMVGPKNARRITPKKCANYRLEPINYRESSIFTDADTAAREPPS